MEWRAGSRTRSAGLGDVDAPSRPGEEKMAFISIAYGVKGEASAQLWVFYFRLDGADMKLHLPECMPGPHLMGEQQAVLEHDV